MQDFRELKVWQKAHELTLDVYRLSREFPKEELYGLTSQLRRACASTAANLVEGRSRGTDANFARFVQMASGSAAEAGYHLLLARDLEYLSQENYTTLFERSTEVRKMLSNRVLKIEANG